MKIHNGAVLLKPTPQVASQIKQAIPKTAQGMVSGALTVAVKHKLEETLVLRNIGFDVPSPINYGWKYPGMYKPRDNQYHTAAFATLYRRGFILNEMRCVDAETEYLSPTGWKRIADYDGGMVAQYDKESGQANFVEPNEYIKKRMPEGEQMIRFKTVKGVDQLLTQNHRVLYVASTGARMVASAESIERANLEAKRGWKGRFITTFDMQIETRLDFSDLELRAMVAVIADGHFGNNTNRCVVRLKKIRKIQRLHALLTAANIEFDYKKDESLTGNGFYVFTFYAPARQKDFSEYWNASNRQLQIIADEVKYWDSSEGKEERTGTFRFSTYSKASADFIQYACAASGRTASLRSYTRFREERKQEETEYVVHVREKAALLYLAAATSDGQNINNISREPSPDGYCYCFTVPKTFLVMRRNGCVFITGNTGKTAASLWAAEYLLQEGFVRRILIVCPKSCMRDVWEQTLFECLPHRAVSILYGDREQRIKMLNKPTEFCIINHDGIAALADKKRSQRGKKDHVEATCAVLKGQFDLIIYDEADVLCNHRNIIYKALTSMIEPTTWLWLMTGTPIPNSYADAWGLLKLIRGGDLPYRSYTQFKEAVMFKISQFKWANKDHGKAILYDLMQPAIRFTQKECFDLPPVQELWRTAELSKEQKVAYWQMQKSGVLDRADASVFAANAAVKLAKLLQISCIEEGTEVLTSEGWKPIETVTKYDRVWDGLEWCTCFGAIYSGYKHVIDCHGVRMTPEHKVLTVNGWATAKEVVYGNAGGRFKKVQNVETIITLQDQAQFAHVWDIAKVSPRHRFAIRNKLGEIFIVHNCGAVKDETGGKVALDASPRLETLLEVLRESGVRPNDAESKKAVVFMPFKYTMQDVCQFLESKGFNPVLINGDITSVSERKRIFDCFKTGSCDILVAHPEVTAHGLDLTVAKTLIWYAPCFGNRLYAQGNMRHQGEKQKDFPAVVHITATRLEKERFAALRQGGLTQAEFLAMYERSLEEEI